MPLFVVGAILLCFSTTHTSNLSDFWPNTFTMLVKHPNLTEIGQPANCFGKTLGQIYFFGTAKPGRGRSLRIFGGNRNDECEEKREG